MTIAAEDLVISGGTLVNYNGVQTADILISGGKIQEIASPGSFEDCN